MAKKPATTTKTVDTAKTVGAPKSKAGFGKKKPALVPSKRAACKRSRYQTEDQWLAAVATFYPGDDRTIIANRVKRAEDKINLNASVRDNVVASARKARRMAKVQAQAAEEALRA